MTQIQKLANELKTMKVNITTQDKKNCVKELDLHHNTVSNYLRGDGRDADTATKLIKFFTKQIEKRNSVINN